MVDVYDFAELTAQTAASPANAFLETNFTGELQHEGDAPLRVGVCDALDRSLFASASWLSVPALTAST